MTSLPKGWTEVALGDVATLQFGYAFDSARFGGSGELPVARIRDVNRGWSSTFYTGPFDPRYVIDDGDVLVGMDGEFNRGRWNGGRALLNQRVCKVAANEELIHGGYLFHFLPGALKSIEARTPSVTVKHLSAKELKAVRVPLPPASEQRRIAAILDKAAELRAKRRAALAHLNSLTQSIFHDMFGEIDASPDRWPRALVGDFVSHFETGKSLVTVDDAEGAGDYRVLKVSAVTSWEYRPTESKLVPAGHEPHGSHFVRSGDLLFSRANTSALVGATALVDETPPNRLLPDKLWRFVWRDPEAVDPMFVSTLFKTRYVRKEIAKRATGTSGSMKNISQEKVLLIDVPWPHPEMRFEFGRRAQRVRGAIGAARRSDVEVCSLFASLQARAFRGEL